jgi:hypothetical protein
MWMIYGLVCEILNVVLHCSISKAIRLHVIRMLMCLELRVNSRPERVWRAFELRDFFAHVEILVGRQFEYWSTYIAVLGFGVITSTDSP